MPRFPDMSPVTAGMQGAVFEKYRDLMQARGTELIRLHIGDTYLPPAYSLPIEPALAREFPDLYRYCDTFGVPEFREALAEKVRQDNHLNISAENALVTCGATNALSSAVHTLLDSNDAIIMLTPCWPIMQGIVRSAGVEITEVPLYYDLYTDGPADLEKYLEQFLQENTAAIYINSPNNPSGKVLGKNQLKQIAAFARRHHLWILADEAYEALLYDGLRHTCIAGIEGIFAQTVSVFTFSKIFMFAGLRLGYAVADKAVIRNMNKIMVHQIYSPPSFSQMMMIRPLLDRHNWMGEVRDHYRSLRDLFVDNLKISLNRPQGTYFIFFDAAPLLKNKKYEELVRGTFMTGVSVAPGEDFGKNYKQFIRLCFTGETPERLTLAVEKLNRYFSGILSED